MDKLLSLENYIDSKDFPFAKLLDKAKLWEPVENLEDFIKDLFKTGVLKPNYQDAKDVYIGEGTKIYQGAVIVGPAIIGNNCIVGHASLLRKNCLLGDNVHIGHAVEVKNSIFLNNSVAAHLNYIGDSIIGNNVNLSGGAIIANFRLDKKPVKLKFDKEVIDTRLLKFGAVIGDFSNIGVNSVLNPGTILGKNSLVYPLSSVTGIHKEGEKIKGAS